MTRAGLALLIAVVFVAVAAPWLAPNPPDRQFNTYLNAPPTRVHVDAAEGAYFFPLRVISRLERRFEEVRDRPVRVAWFSGHLVASTDDREPLLLLGADSYGRDIFSRLLHGARASLGLALFATLAALIIGVVVGGVAGYAGGAADELLSRLAELGLVLPATYGLRA